MEMIYCLPRNLLHRLLWTYQGIKPMSDQIWNIFLWRITIDRIG